MPPRSKQADEALWPRHRKGCPAHDGGKCRCKPSYTVRVWDQRSGRRVVKTFPTRAAAKSFRDDTRRAISKGALAAPSKKSVREAADEFLEKAKAGAIYKSTRARSGVGRYGQYTIINYESSLRRYILPVIGDIKLSDLRRTHVQDLVDLLAAGGPPPRTTRKVDRQGRKLCECGCGGLAPLARWTKKAQGAVKGEPQRFIRGHQGCSIKPERISTVLTPLAAICSHAIDRNELVVNPCDGVRYPARPGRRERIATIEEARQLIAALPEGRERTILAIAFYAGLRLAEARALRVPDVDLQARIIRVRRSWPRGEDEREGGKTLAAKRDVMIVEPLADELQAHMLRTGASGDDLLVGKTTREPFIYPTLYKKIYRIWDAAGLARIKPHEARHTFVSLCVAAGVPPHTTMVMAGHESFSMTMDYYAKIMPGAHDEARQLFERQLGRVPLGVLTGTAVEVEPAA